MVVLSGLIYLPRRAIAAIGLAMIAGHNLLDGIGAGQFGSAGWMWTLLHEPKLLALYGDTTLFALYPLIPWVGVMATGYALVHCSHSTARSAYAGSSGSASAPRRVSCSCAR